MIDPSFSAAAAPSPSAGGGGLAARRGFITLDEAAWAAIRSEYLAGATGRQIAEKWGCSRVAVYDHASKGGWTKRARGAALSRSVLEDTRAEQAARAALAQSPPPEADPLLAARLLLRQAAASALLGRGVEAFEGVRMAESLARCARLLCEAEHGLGEARAKLLAEAKQALEDDPDYTPLGWRDSEEATAMREQILRNVARLRKERGRAPPQHLPMWFMLDDHAAHRPLAEALGLVVEGRDWVECPDFEAAVEKARAEGRGEAIDLALSTPVPWELCTWLTDEEKAAQAAREGQAQRLADEAAAEVASGLGWAGDEAVGEALCVGDGAGEPERAGSAGMAPAGASGPAMRRLGEGDAPWSVLRRRSTGLGDPYAPLS